MPEARSGALSIYFEEIGAGVPVIFLSGLGVDHRPWSVLQPGFSRYRMVTLDNRDVGRSSMATSPYTMRDLAEDVLAVLDHLKLATAHVVGHSLGGQVAQELCLAHPARVRSLVLANTWAKTDRYLAARMRVWRTLRRHIKNDEAFLEIMTFYGTPPDLLAAVPLDDLMRATRAMFVPQLPEAFLRGTEANLAANTQDRLSAITCPTLVIWGSRDVILPPPYAQVLLGGIQGARGVCIEGTGHGSAWEDTPAFLAAVVGFLDGVDSPYR
jgi:3-oxoadipate enol-lactonase